MIDKTITISVFIDDIMKESGYKEPINRNATDSGIITTALIAANYFHGHIDNAINIVKTTALMLFIFALN